MQLRHTPGVRSMELEIRDIDIITHGVNTLISGIGVWMIATAHFNPSQLTTEVPAVAGAFGMLMIMAGFLFALVLGDDL